MTAEPDNTGRTLQNTITPDWNRHSVPDLDSEEDSAAEASQEEQQEETADPTPLDENQVMRRILQP